MLFLSDFKNNNRIKGIQRGISVISPSVNYANTTISSVNTDKTRLRLLGHSPQGTTTDQFPVTIYLLNSTTVQVYRGRVSGSYSNISWELTEWE